MATRGGIAGETANDTPYLHKNLRLSYRRAATSANATTAAPSPHIDGVNTPIGRPARIRWMRPTVTTPPAMAASASSGFGRRRYRPATIGTNRLTAIIV